MSVDELKQDFINNSRASVDSAMEIIRKERNPVIPVYLSIKAAVQDFEKNIDNNFEVGVQLASFSKNMTMQVRRISYNVPFLIDFWGYVDGKKAHLIQHINQLNFLLVALPIENPEKPKRPIGFHS